MYSRAYFPQIFNVNGYQDENDGISEIERQILIFLSFLVSLYSFNSLLEIQKGLFWYILLK